MSATFLGLPRFLIGGGESSGDSGSCFRLPLFNGGGDGGGESASSIFIFIYFHTALPSESSDPEAALPSESSDPEAALPSESSESDKKH